VKFQHDQVTSFEQGENGFSLELRWGNRTVIEVDYNFVDNTGTAKVWSRRLQQYHDLNKVVCAYKD
jgi:hypothetical protein